MGELEHEKRAGVTVGFESPFEFERYIEERLREIGDLDERRVAKAVLAEGLKRIFQCTEEKYQALERRIYEEIEIPGNCYETCSLIVDKRHYDPTNDTLFPVCQEDLDEEKLRGSLSEKTKLYLETVYLRMNEQALGEFENSSARLKGIIHSEEGVEETLIEVCPSARYRKMVERLYQVFEDNCILWNTVNTAYLDKFYDVFVCWGQEDGQDVLSKMPEVEVSFGKWEPFVQRGMMPLWNVQKIVFGSASFMMPCPDGIHFEHEFIPEYEDQNDGYVIQANEDILEIRHEEGKMILRSARGTFDNWIAYRLVQTGPVLSLDYIEPVLTNRKRDSFLRRYAEKTQCRLLTKADLFRRIMEMDIRDYLEIDDYQICDKGSDFPLVEGMNWFIRDELFPMDSRKVLLFIFKEKQPGCYLNDAMMRFVVSQMQLEINEYRCAGRIR